MSKELKSELEQLRAISARLAQERRPVLRITDQRPEPPPVVVEEPEPWWRRLIWWRK